MNYKLLMYWDVKPGTDEEYSEFVLREWVPGMEALGLQHSEAWLTLWPQQSGERPRIMTGGLLESLAKARAILKSKEWSTLCDQLERYVENFSFKVVQTTGEFQM